MRSLGDLRKFIAMTVIRQAQFPNSAELYEAVREDLCEVLRTITKVTDFSFNELIDLPDDTPIGRMSAEQLQEIERRLEELRNRIIP